MRLVVTRSLPVRASGIAVVAVSLLLGLSTGARSAWAAEESAAADRGASAKPAPTVPLDRLLRLPTGVSYDVETRGGLNRSEWRARFTQRTRERDDAKLALDASQEELSEIAAKTDAWNLGTPGTGVSADAGDPLSFRLDLQIRREREALEEAEQKLEALEVEANLAKVPKPWREPSPPRVPEELASEDW